MMMSRYEKLVLILPDEAAARLKEVADQESQTVAGFVANVVDDWLEKRRKDVRLGRTRQRGGLPQAQTGSGTGKRR
jgi:predicted DNA-binding protein